MKFNELMSKTQYVCQECGASFPTWSGQCLVCGAWNSLVEEVIESGVSQSQAKLSSVRLNELLAHSQVKGQRLSTGLAEFDRVLGGGLVDGGVMLLVGSPGVGKSTLLTQVALALILSRSKFSVAYVAGEESPSQIALRVKRVIENEQLKSSVKKPTSPKNELERLEFVNCIQVERVVKHLKKTKPSLVIVDSVQTLISKQLSGVAGSVGQVRASAEKLIEFAKAESVPVFLVGHVTKEGRVAGPMTLEHMVDVVLDFSGDKNTNLRLLRATKNRFGATDEVGVFQLDEVGFQTVANPSKLFTSHQDYEKVAGAVFACVVEGTRPMVVEVQALVTPSFLPTPRRVGRGVDSARLQVLSAVLEKHLELPLGSHDIFVSIVGGYRTKEPALDLAIAAAIISSLNNKPMGKRVFVGEVGLLGEVRRVKLFGLREREVTRLGYKDLISFKNLKNVCALTKL